MHVKLIGLKKNISTYSVCAVDEFKYFDYF